MRKIRIEKNGICISLYHRMGHLPAEPFQNLPLLSIVLHRIERKFVVVLSSRSNNGNKSRPTEREREIEKNQTNK